MSFGENQRFKDVLFALQAATESGQKLGRLQLQKFVYLADILAEAWRKVGKPAAFLPYRNGPYDPSIQNAADALVFRGLVDVSHLTFRRPRITESNYDLTSSGKEAVQRATEIDGFDDDLALYQEIAREVAKRGWKNIKALVYAEPTYDTASATTNSQRLQTDSRSANLSLGILRDFEAAFRIDDAKPISRRNMIQLFFAVLDEHAAVNNENG